jgi:hypothetical protein
LPDPALSEPLFTVPVDHRRIEGVDTGGLRASKDGRQFGAADLPAPIGDAVGEAELGGAKRDSGLRHWR